MHNIRNKNCTKVEKTIFSLFLALYPVLCVYRGIFNFTIGDLILICWFIYSLRYPIMYDSRMNSVIIFSFYAGFFLVFNIVFSNITATFNTVALLLRFVKFVFYMTCVFIDLKIFSKAIVVIATIAVGIVILQYISFYLMNQVLLGFIPGLPVYLEEYTEIDYDIFYSNQFRPAAIFVEPAALSQYLAAALVCTLFIRKVFFGIKKLIFCLIISMGILLSTSAQGIVYLLLIYGSFIFWEIKRKRNIVFVLLAIISIGVVLYNNTEYVRNGINRLLYGEDAANARFGAYAYCISLDIGPLLIGYGYGTTYNGEYFAGAAYIWYGCGFIGLILSINIFFSFYHRAMNRLEKVMCLLFCVMFIGTGLFYNYMLFWYFSMMLLSKKNFNVKYQKSKVNLKIREEGFA